MFDPRDTIRPPVKVAVTCQYVYEGGKHYLVISFGGGSDDWQKIQINRHQVVGLIESTLPRVLSK